MSGFLQVQEKIDYFVSHLQIVEGILGFGPYRLRLADPGGVLPPDRWVLGRASTSDGQVRSNLPPAGEPQHQNPRRFWDPGSRSGAGAAVLSRVITVLLRSRNRAGVSS